MAMIAAPQLAVAPLRPFAMGHDIAITTRLFIQPSVYLAAPTPALPTYGLLFPSKG